MGERTVAQEALSHEFSLERYVRAGHLLRLIDRFVDLSGMCEQLQPFYSETGRPSIDPELMIRMLIRAQERFGLWPERLAADTGYGDAANLAWLVHERGIEPHVPVFEKSGFGLGLARADFTYDAASDHFTCPAGKEFRQFWQMGRAAKAMPPGDDTCPQVRL